MSQDTSGRFITVDGIDNALFWTLQYYALIEISTLSSPPSINLKSQTEDF
jgi:hypothetical protein